MRPGKERWFDVALVVDESTSMIVWEETVDELDELKESLEESRREKVLEEYIQNF